MISHYIHKRSKFISLITSILMKINIKRLYNIGISKMFLNQKLHTKKHHITYIIHRLYQYKLTLIS